MLRYITDCGSPVKGALWYQGESDTGEAERAAYKQRFANFVSDLRQTMKDSHLPVITVQLNRYVGEELTAPVHANWEAMREIQRQLSHELKEVYIFPIFEATLSDGIHNDSLGNLLIGQRAATTALGAVYGQDIAWRHPECVGARQLASTVIELTFENVTGRLHGENKIRRDAPFSVRDSQGDVPIAHYNLPANDKISLTLSRPLADTVSVTGAPTANPPYDIPFDIPGYRCMLGFTLPVSTH